MVTKKSAVSTQYARFFVVGCTAALVHLAALALIVEALQWHPLHANIPAWLIALTVSYVGQRRFTFVPQHSVSFDESVRFVVTSVIALGLNQFGYMFALQQLGNHYLVALIPILFVVSIVTFLLNRYWVFSGRN